MHRGATPTYTIEFSESIRGLTKLSLVFAQQGQIKLEKTIDDVSIIDDTHIEVSLTEAETLLFEQNPDTQSAYVDIQARLGYGAQRAATNIAQVIIQPIIKEGAL